MKCVLQFTSVSQKQVANIEVMRDYGFLDLGFNRKVVSNFLQRDCGVMGLNAIHCFADLSRTYFQDTNVIVFAHISIAGG
jgi:hypothetical protein